MYSDIFALNKGFKEFNLTDENLKAALGKISALPGVYIIYIKPAKKIQRIRNTDETGILYIGKTQSLYRRIHQFRRSANGSYEHSGGIKYFRFSYLRNTFLLEKLFVRVKETKNIDTDELKLQKKYIEIFGELPTLNSTIGRDK